MRHSPCMYEGFISYKADFRLARKLLQGNTVCCWLGTNLISAPSYVRKWPPITIICSTHWGQVVHICVSKLTIIGSDNGLPPDRRQAIIWTNAGILLIRTLGTNFSEILGETHFHSRKCIWKWRLRKGVYLDSASVSWRELCYYHYPRSGMVIGSWQLMTCGMLDSQCIGFMSVRDMDTDEFTAWVCFKKRLP